MPVIFEIQGINNWFTTDPEVVPSSRQVQKGDYVRLPDDRVYRLVTDYPTVFVLVPESEVPSAVYLLEAKAYDAVNGKVIE